MSTPRFLDFTLNKKRKYPEAHFGSHLDRSKVFHVIRIKEHVSHCGPTPVDFVWIASYDYSFKNYMHWVTLS